MPNTTYTRILEATIEQLHRSGPVDFRIDELVATTGQSVGGIYHHFGSRDGLLIAAYEHIVGTLLEGDVAVLRHFLETSQGPEEFLAGLRQMMVTLHSAERNDLRWLRLEGMALARRKPELWEALKNVHLRHAKGLTDALGEAQRRGWLRNDLSSYHLYLALSGMAVGAVTDSIGRQSLNPEDWAEDVMTIFAGRVLTSAEPGVR
jgi:AcrR family transcriptional regulator